MTLVSDLLASLTKLSVGTGNNDQDYVEVASIDSSGNAQITKVTLDSGTKTASATSGAATLNKNAGVVTSESLTTSAGSDYVLTLTNSAVLATSIVLVSVANGTNTTEGLAVNRVQPSAGSCVIHIRNTHASSALNGTIAIAFAVIN